jgi:MFS family permease
MVAFTMDASILPNFFHEFQILFDVGQADLNTLSACKGWAAALFAFPCGFVGELLPRPQLIGTGMIFWAAGLAVCSMSESFELLFAARVLNGVGLGIVQPLLLSLVADTHRPTKRGSAFGALFFTGAVCNTIFVYFATRYAATDIAGIVGWRFSLSVIAAFSVLIGMLIMGFATEPNKEQVAQKRETSTFASAFRENLPKVWELFKIPTFVLILAQGAPGSAPWTVFPNLTQWLELSCFTHAETALIMSAFGWGCACSSLLSGILLNLVARRHPDRGPPTIACFSVVCGIPFLTLFFFILPKPAGLGEGFSDVPLYYVLFLAFGLGAAMCGVVNKKVFADIVPPTSLTYVYAVDQLIEQGVGNLAGVAVGVVTDRVFNFDKEAIKPGVCAPEEGHKLGMGMLVVCTVAWVICFSVYAGMFWTYPKDRREMRQRTIKSETMLPADLIPPQLCGKECSPKAGQESCTEPPC